MGQAFSLVRRVVPDTSRRCGTAKTAARAGSSPSISTVKKALFRPKPPGKDADQIGLARACCRKARDSG